MTKRNQILPGEPFPLGATLTDEGVNFAIYSENATGVDLCFYDIDDPTKETHRIALKEVTDYIWHGFVKGIRAGQLYGYRVSGPYEPENGHRFNPNKLLLDPNAKAVSGIIDWNDALYGYEVGHPDGDLSFSKTDSAPYIPKAVVIDPSFDWQDDKSPKLKYYNTIIYEAHVKGLTKQHADIPEELRGTYAGIAHPVTISYLKELGITAIELMPVHHFVTDRSLRGY
ncbi:hypothetical protein [Mucilaginibacter aquaedulcis]|uniref:hypothetical protein n=1 Tax=Mucilaginibacter aquaedulcis TaxID=1187081 RepID=UPI0025B34CE2|nr:hypothetical protein [Mucilaginibacter aquaedulcis]MDN3551161.1 hypothetical protein [Mucilaginibacter aquaedulcis]